jgi:glycosyltransferase involved in cell wall biosynthesis
VAPEVSVIVPTRDRWSCLRRTLRGAFSQEDVRLEVIVVDEASSDETPDGLRGLARKELRVLRNERSRGQAAARNQGIEAARGEWLAFLDDDDLWAPWKLRRQLDAARGVGAGFAYASAVVVDEGLRPIEQHEAPPAEDLARPLIRGNAVPAGASNVLANADLVRSIGGFDERLNQLTDWELWLRLARSARAACCAELLLAYLYHPGNYVLRSTPEIWREFEHVAGRHADFARETGASFDPAGLTFWIAQRQAEMGLRFRAVRTYLRGAVHTRRPHHMRLAARTLVLGPPKSRAVRDIPSPEWLRAYRDDA